MKAWGSSLWNQHHLCSAQESTLQNQAPRLCEKGTLEDLRVPFCSAHRAIMDLSCFHDSSAPPLALSIWGWALWPNSPCWNVNTLPGHWLAARGVHHGFQAVRSFVSLLSATSFSGCRYVTGYGCNCVYWQWTSLRVVRCNFHRKFWALLHVCPAHVRAYDLF